MTTTEVYNLDHSKANRYNFTTFNQNGLYYLLAKSPKCLILSTPNNTVDSISMFNYDSVAGSYSQDPTNFLTLTGNNSNHSNTSSSWFINDNCDRILVGFDYYYKNNGGSWAAVITPNNFTAEVHDKNLDYAIDNGELYKYDTNTNAFVL